MNKNNHCSKLLVLLAFLMASSFSAAAYDFMVDSICYNVIGENEVEVTERDIKYKGEVIIPATVVQEGVTYHVTRIGNNAFRGCDEMVLIDIPEGVTVIDQWAFNGCNHLEVVEFPNSLLRIEKYAFYNCVSIQTLNITRNIEYIAYNAICFCHGITNYTCSALNRYFSAENGILYSKDKKTLWAYPQAAPATSFDIPSNVTTLYDYCLHNCDNLTQISIPESVTVMGMNIFSNCDNIESIYIPDGVTKMGVTVCGSCPKLSNVHLPASADSLQSSFFYNCPSLIEVTIPRNIKYIGTFAFTESKNLKTINFEEGSCLDCIDLRAFENCYALDNFDMPNSVTTIKGQIFGYCRGLKNIHLSEGLINLAGATFYNCTGLTDVEVPSNVSFVSNLAFGFCSSLRSVKIGSKDAAPGTTFLEQGLFYNCDNLVRIELGANVDSIEYYALNDPRNAKVFISWAMIPPKYGTSFSEPGPSNRNAVLYVPRAAIDAYREAIFWKKFSTIVAIEDVGDVNGDNTIGIGDAAALIDILLEGGTDINALADVNLDGEVSIADVTALIDQLLGGQ